MVMEYAIKLEPDYFVNDPQWSDIDGDGYGDNESDNLPMHVKIRLETQVLTV